MERVILRHLRGSKASQIEEFPLDQFSEMTLGRDPSANVRFDPEQDDLVGRQHARIARDPANRYQFTVTDLNSRNGTFLNKQRVTGTAALSPGDVLQLGAGGPEIQFDIDPLPPQLMKATRMAVVGGATGDPGATRSSDAKPASGGVPVATKPFYGKETVMRMIGQTKTDSRRNLMYLGAAAVVVLAGTVAWQTSNTDRVIDDANADAERRNQMTQAQLDSIARVAGGAAERSAALTPAEIAQRYAAAVVQIEFSWKLIHSGQSGQVFHMHIPNQVRTQQGVRPIIDDGRRNIPAYIMVGDNQWEPWLTVDRGEVNTPIGVSSGGTGFVVKKTGLILTNRHVAANWRAPYRNWGDQRQSLGVLLDGSGNLLRQQDGSPIIVPPPSRWIPDETKQDGPKGTMGQYQPQVEYIYASFPKNTIRRAASEAAVSDRHDLALIKIETGQDSLPTLELYDNYDKIQVGDAVTVLGYPSLSDEVFAVIKSKDTFNREAQVRVIPDPTLSAGHVGKVLRAADGPANDAAATYAPSGDRYQLTINSTGGGNSGGPMFDSFGRVIGVFFAGRIADAQVSFSVPIRYALELMNIAPNSP